MSNVSIFEKKWLDLVFEGKNQKYGAYQLRRESSRTTAFALIFGISFLVGGTFLLSSFSTKPSNERIIPVVLPPSTNVDPILPPDEPEKPKTKEPETTAPETEVIKPNAPLEVVATVQAQPDVPRNVDQPRNPVSPESPGTGGPGPSPISTGGGGPSIVKAPANNNPVSSKELDRQPMFPGGLKGFYEYVGNNFERQEIEEGETVRVLVSFVIEKNGTMTDIEVTEKTTDAVDKEAIRVLKSLRTKWSPGFKDGEPVRTRYTLPISVKSE